MSIDQAQAADQVIEHMLAVALCADCGGKTGGHQFGRLTLPGWAIGAARTTLTSALPMRMPSQAYAHVDQLNGDRLVATTHRLLMAHPADIVGNGFEVMALAEGAAIWHRLEPISTLPRGVAAAGRVHFWAAMHSRKIAANGLQVYHSTLVPFSRDGQPMAAQWNGAWITRPADYGQEAIAACSLLEDALRPNALLASVSDGVELIFPVDQSAYLEAFSLREKSATQQGRRQALLHWVARHMRTTRRGQRDVKRHMRGTQEFEIGGYRVRLWSVDSSAPQRAAWPGHEAAA